MVNLTAKLTEKAPTWGAIGMGLAAIYQLFYPNTAFDRLTAKHLWCDPEPAASESKERSDSKEIRLNSGYLTKNGKLDNLFGSMNTGDKLRYGDLILEAIDSRKQSASYGPNKLGTPDSLIQLECPGYIKLRVMHDNQLVDGGEGVEIVYAAKFLGSGGFFDGYPDFNLMDVLKETELSSEQISVLLNGAYAVESAHEQKLQKEREEAEIKDYEKGVDSNPELRSRVESCKSDFKTAGSDFFYQVKRGDSKVSVSRRFNQCLEDQAFFPTQYGRVDTIYGLDVCSQLFNYEGRCSDNQQNLHSNKLVYVRARDPKTLLKSRR